MRTEPAAGDARLRFGLFAALLAAAILLHQLWWNGFDVRPLPLVVALTALVVLLRPTSVPCFLALLAAAVVSVAEDMPGAGSHMVLLAVCGATVLADTACTVLRTRRWPAPGALFERIAPFLRVSLLLLYAAAALAKMNSGFFDPAISCAAALTPRIAWFDPALLDAAWLAWPAIVGTVLVEAGLPILLAVRRTRVAGLVLGVAFHLALALAGNVPFTALVFAFYVAFLPAGTLSRVRAASTLGPVAGWVRPLASALLVGGWSLGAVAENASPAAVREAIGDGTRLAVVALVLGFAAGAFAVRRSAGPRDAVDALAWRPTGPLFAVGFAVLVANALTPYVGLKTESSFAMFSNLHTEAGYWNHAFVPEVVRVFPHQDRLVTVTASNDPALLRRTRGGTRMVRFELERYLRGHPEVYASYVPAAGAARAAPLAAVVDRVAKFRDVRAPGRRGC